jgi:chromatin remodeling complex protein RSC6
VRARREKVETENKVLRGELIKKKEVQKAVLQITAQLKSEFQNFPIRLSPSLAAAIIGLGPTASANEIEATVRKVWENEAYKALEQILCGEVVP